MAEYDFVNEIAPGARGKRARLVQEWLSLHGHHVGIDNGFGAATEKVVKDLQGANGLRANGRVDKKTFDLLVAPMRKSWAWCAGFACVVLRQAADTLGRPAPVKSSFSCDLLATSATTSGCLLCWTPSLNVEKVTPGSIFLSRRIVGDWVHTGIVVKADAQIFTTIEGNTNDAGDREGYEVCQRVRGYKDKDFIIIS